MQEKQFFTSQIGDFPYRRRNDRRPNVLALVCWLLVMCMAAFGVLSLVGALWHR